MSQPSFAAFTVTSDNFSFHQPIECASLDEAKTTAKRRGFDATIRCAGERVAHWSAIGGFSTNHEGLRWAVVKLAERQNRTTDGVDQDGLARDFGVTRQEISDTLRRNQSWLAP
jgi:hypothetical protein